MNKKTVNKFDVFKWIYTIIVYIFLYAPIIVLMVYSFNGSKSRGKWGGFSLKWYESLFSNTQIMQALYNTILIAVLSSIIATIIGTCAAIGINAMTKKSKAIVMNITYLPILNPDIVTGLSLMLLFVFMKMSFGFSTLLLAHITFNIPYVILAVLPKLKQLNNNMYEAALDLGASPIEAFFKVIMPEIMPGIITGLLFAFTLSVDDFVISFFTTGAGVSNLSIVIYAAARKGVDPSINALSTLMFISILLLLILINYRTNKKEGVLKNEKEI